MTRRKTSFADAQAYALRRLKSPAAPTYAPAAVVFDVYAPEWTAAPAGAICHTVQADGRGVFWSVCPELMPLKTANGIIYIWASVAKPFVIAAYNWDGENPDHRNSLRFMPIEKDTTSDD